MIIWLRSALYNGLFYAWTTLICVTLLWTLLLPRRAVVLCTHLWLTGNDLLEKYVLGLSYRVIGREHIPEGACIIAAKHQSEWETLKLHALFGDPTIVLKIELMRIPLWGAYASRIGVIPVDRSAKGKALNGMLGAAQAIANQGRKIVIFPQGTRVNVGQYLPYKVGVAALAEDLKIPVVPMALNSGVYWPKESFLKRPGTITIEFLPAMPSGLSTEEFMRQLEDKLESRSKDLCAATSSMSS
jgi:1-acyl-sn-glycerol-3-phosphate acyltransferase